MGKKFRNYINSDRQNNVEKTYEKMHKNQRFSLLKTMYSYYGTPHKKYNIWDLINKLNYIVDESDPDTELEQIYHSYQTAESIKLRYFDNFNKLKNINTSILFSKEELENMPKKYRDKYKNSNINELYPHINDWEWLILVGFIHDLGKILLLEEFGAHKQWYVVGDIFPLGCDLHESVIFYDKQFYVNNPDLNMGKVGLYKENCGFSRVDMSYGHDEFLANVLVKNKIEIPKEAVYMIKYHSFYAWHTPPNGNIGYKYLASEEDWINLPLLKILQKADLYSKSTNLPDITKIIKEYKILVEKYIPNSEMYF